MAFWWLINGGDPTYLLRGMILQVDNRVWRVAGCEGLFLFQWEESLISYAPQKPLRNKAFIN